MTQSIESIWVKGDLSTISTSPNDAYTEYVIASSVEKYVGIKKILMFVSGFAVGVCFILFNIYNAQFFR